LAIVKDTVAFFEAFEGMEQGFRDRAEKVEELLADEGTSFVVVSSPRRDAVAEAVFFADRLQESSGRVGALIVNRMFPSFGPVPGGLEGDLATNMAQLNRVATTEEHYVSELSERLPGAPVIRVPFLSDDVHDLEGLAEVGAWLLGEKS
jgi:anion-transporting  ArsA/GET3 family ATPase